jgi:hypothetical protein
MTPAQLPAQNLQRSDAVATILQSGSTNARGYAITIYDDGSATAVLDAAENALRSSPTQLQQFPAGTIDSSRLQALLGQIGDVSTIPTGSCPSLCLWKRGLRSRIKPRPAGICNASGKRVAQRRHSCATLRS